jgi:hypothetical protein
MPLHIENWVQTSFFDYGTPPLMTISENIFNSEKNAKHFIFIPQYGVLKWNLHKEESVYIMLEEPADTSLFFLYPSKHPGSSNYKINVTHFSVEVCENTEKCQKLKDCEKAIVNMKNDTNNPNMVFLSWKLFEPNLLVILGQYEDTLFICRHDKPEFEIKKLVMFNSKSQSIGIIDGSFQSTTKELPTKNIEKFDLTENTYVSMHIFQCYYCSISVELICANSIVNKEVVSGRDGYRMIFSNSFILHGWKKINLSKKGQTYKDCSLVIEPKLLESVDRKQVNPTWNIAQCVITYLDDTNELTEVSTTISTARSTITDDRRSTKTTVSRDGNQIIGQDSHKKLKCIEDKVQTCCGQWFIIFTTIMLIIIFLILCIVVFPLIKLVSYSGLNFDKRLVNLFRFRKFDNILTFATRT